MNNENNRQYDDLRAINVLQPYSSMQFNSFHAGQFSIL